MAFEKRLTSVGPISFTLDGTANGIITVASTKLFKVKAEVEIKATSLPTLFLEIKSIPNSTQIYVGLKGNIRQRSDISAYTVALNATLSQPEQSRPGITNDDQDRATFEEEPTLARRVYNVDYLGNPYDDSNPFPVNVVSGGTTTNVELPLRFDKVSNSVMYLAEGIFGALDSEPKWKIKKIEIIGPLVSIKLASAEFDKIWDNRLVLAYV